MTPFPHLQNGIIFWSFTHKFWEDTDTQAHQKRHPRLLVTGFVNTSALTSQVHGFKIYLILFPFCAIPSNNYFLLRLSTKIWDPVTLKRMNLSSERISGYSIQIELLYYSCAIFKRQGWIFCLITRKRAFLESLRSCIFPVSYWTQLAYRIGAWKIDSLTLLWFFHSFLHLIRTHTSVFLCTPVYQSCPGHIVKLFVQAPCVTANVLHALTFYSVILPLWLLASPLDRSSIRSSILLRNSNYQNFNPYPTPLVLLLTDCRAGKISDTRGRGSRTGKSLTYADTLLPKLSKCVWQPHTWTDMAFSQHLCSTVSFMKCEQCKKV